MLNKTRNSAIQKKLRVYYSVKEASKHPNDETRQLKHFNTGKDFRTKQQRILMYHIIGNIPKEI